MAQGGGGANVPLRPPPSLNTLLNFSAHELEMMSPLTYINKLKNSRIGLTSDDERKKML